MNDTPPDIDAAFTAMFAERSGSERVRMMSEMFDMARKLMVADIKAHEPDISDVELRVRIFERTYWGDFSRDEHNRIVEKIRSEAAS